MTVEKYCHLVNKTINLSGVSLYKKHLTFILNSKASYRYYLEDEFHNFNFFISVLSSMDIT